MTIQLTATITKKGWGDPVVKQLYYQGESFDDILERIKKDAQIPSHLEHCMHNLRFHRKCSFRDANGVRHLWALKEMEGLN